MKLGFPSLNKSSKTTDSFNIQYQDSNLFVSRVLDVIMDSNHPDFNNLGGYSSIGVISFQNTKSSNSNSDELKNYAFPLNPNNKVFPLKNEIVLIVKIDFGGNNVGKKSNYYYLGVINVWNTPHHNAIPNLVERINETLDDDGNPLLKLIEEHNGKFVEKQNIHPLKHYPGDIIHEGRNGNSIRLGSTNLNKDNEWSSEGMDGDPILILNNEITQSDIESWIPLSEKIDIGSKIYLTSTQILPIQYTDDLFSLNQTVTHPKEYNDRQIVLSTGRVVLNALDDGVLISGNKFTHIHSYDEVGIDSKKSITLSSSQVKLGDKEATESVVHGNKLLESLIHLTEITSNLIELFSEIKDWPGGNPIPSQLAALAEPLKLEVDNLTKLYRSEQMLSKIVKVK